MKHRYRVDLGVMFRKAVYVIAENHGEAERIAQDATMFDETWEMDGIEFEADAQELGKRFNKDVAWLRAE